MTVLSLDCGRKDGCYTQNVIVKMPVKFAHAARVHSAFFSKLLNFVLNFLDDVALVIVHPEVKNWLKYARFEEKNQFVSSARQIYERAVEYFGDEHIDEGLLIAFAKFEEGQREVWIAC